MKSKENEKCPPDCGFCKEIKKEEIKDGQKIALFFKADTLERRKLHQFNNAKAIGTVKSIRIDEFQKIYSIIIENGTASEFIVSSIEKFFLVCDKCAENN